MGKTTLMQRVNYQVKKEYRKKGLIPVMFSEEQYAVRTLYKLWEHIIRFLEENELEYVGISQELEKIQDHDHYEEACYELLQKHVKNNEHQLLLLIDNFGVMLDKFGKQEQQRFREILTTSANIKIIGGTAVVLESFYRYDKPFFDFFKIVQLSPLNSEEVQTLLLRLGEKHKGKHIKKIIDTQPGRIEALRILTGGVPRTIVMLFNIFLDTDHGNSIDDLKKILDMVTPLYKYRMDDLPAPQQEIVEKLALNWDGMSVSELVNKTRMESKVISAQLNSLAKSGVVRADKSSGKNKFYQLEERFFNIWYLMQHAPKSSIQKVIWLTRFLELWCSGEVLEEMAQGFASRLRQESMNPEYVKAMTNAYATTQGLSLGLRGELIEAATGALKGSSEDLPLSYQMTIDRLKKLLEEEKYNESFRLIKNASLSEELSNTLLGYSYEESGRFEESKAFYEKAVEKGSVFSMHDLALLYEVQYEDYKKAEKYYLMAIESGNVKSMLNLALLYENQFEDYKQAEKYYLMGVEYGNVTSMYNLGLLYQQQYQDDKKAAKYYVEAIEQGDVGAINSMIHLIITNNDKQYVKKSGVWVDKLLKENIDNRSKLIKIRYLLWIDEPEEATLFLKEILPEVLEDEDCILMVSSVLAFAFSKGLRQYVLKLFQQEEYHLKDRFKILYYAMMKLMENEYPNEIKKMGKELEEPVTKMVEYIEHLEKKYS